MPTTILWFRQDLRLRDNPALHAALKNGGLVLPIYILDDAAEGAWRAGGASRWWLHHSLVALDASLRERGSRLLIAKGDSGAVLTSLRARELRTRRPSSVASFWRSLVTKLSSPVGSSHPTIGSSRGVGTPRATES
jgi:deoxyribodipyrimidine photolyase